ncbi:phosphohistidine phosphatase SixA [Sulfuracidifex metallicus]|uniref:phosphohistidine phosphatase SixA n=1 Tax=Sulfuracidifex metallicus TaxID=47303 RepID=UPI0022765187|nr:phosphohistidine phosphatase SixA [Sulfuracidifex metallicus]MCY0850075.1 phosphohistidine phosphatase SixA [Sulfuracidifex metallicus]
MKVALVRHGDAEDQSPDLSDKERKLVKKGIKQMRRVGEFLSQSKFFPDKVISSPYLRAYQSADVILDEMQLDSTVQTSDQLLPEADPFITLQFMSGLESSVVLLIGHNPHLVNLIKLTTGAEVSLKKGGIAIIDLDKETKKGILEILLDQKTLKLV